MTVFEIVDFPTPKEFSTFLILPSSSRQYNTAVTCFSTEIESQNPLFFQNHKKRKDSLETRAACD